MDMANQALLPEQAIRASPCAGCSLVVSYSSRTVLVVSNSDWGSAFICAPGV